MKMGHSFIALALLAARLLSAAPVTSDPAVPNPHQLRKLGPKFANAHGPKFIQVPTPKFVINNPDGPVILKDWKITTLPTPTVKIGLMETAIVRQVVTITETMTITPDKGFGGDPTAVQVVATVTALPVKYRPQPLAPPQWWGKTWLPGYKFRVRWWESRLARLRLWATRAHVRAAKHRARKAALKLARQRRRILWHFKHRKHGHYYRREPEELGKLD